MRRMGGRLTGVLQGSITIRSLQETNAVPAYAVMVSGPTR